jgi:hypothetical protein
MAQAQLHRPCYAGFNAHDCGVDSTTNRNDRGIPSHVGPYCMAQEGLV